MELYTWLLAMSLVDEEGRQLFTGEADRQALAGRNWNRLQVVAERIFAFNGMGKESGELGKN